MQDRSSLAEPRRAWTRQAPSSFGPGGLPRRPASIPLFLSPATSGNGQTPQAAAHLSIHDQARDTQQEVAPGYGARVSGPHSARGLQGPRLPGSPAGPHGSSPSLLLYPRAPGCFACSPLLLSALPLQPGVCAQLLLPVGPQPLSPCCWRSGLACCPPRDPSLSLFHTRSLAASFFMSSED